MIDRFGRERLAVELWDHGDPIDATRNDALAVLAVERGVAPVATNNVHYATPGRFPLATALAAVRARRPLEELEGWLPPSGTACLRGEAEQRRRFARWPGVVDTAGAIADACAFDLRLVAPRLPDFPVPDGHTEQSFLVELAGRGATDRYGPRDAERVPGAWVQLDHELGIIGELGFAGYFLTVWDIVSFCRRADILCQGRGSAATSAVCYALGITNVDAVSLGLLFERFLSPRATGRRTSTWTSSRAGARRSSSTSTSATAACTPPRWRTSSPTGRARRCATSARRSGTISRRSTRGRSRSIGGSRSVRGETFLPCSPVSPPR